MGHTAVQTNPACGEEERLRALEGSGLLEPHDTRPFDRITWLARRSLEADAAMVSVVGRDRQVFTSHEGLTGRLAEEGGSTLDRSFCKYVVASGRRFTVTDARHDPLVRDNTLVTEDGLSAYAGHPLESEGQVLGTLCVVTWSPREWSPEDVDVLAELAALVVEQIEHHVTVRELRELRKAARRLPGPVGRLGDAVRTTAALADSPGDPRLPRMAESARTALKPVEAMVRDLADTARRAPPERMTDSGLVDLRERIVGTVGVVAASARPEDLEVMLGRSPVIVEWYGPDLGRALSLALMTALRHLGPGDTVRVTLGTDSGRALLTVTTGGRRLPTGDLLRVAGAFLGEDAEAAHVASRKDVVTVSAGGLVASTSPDGSELRLAVDLAGDGAT